MVSNQTPRYTGGKYFGVELGTVVVRIKIKGLQYEL